MSYELVCGCGCGSADSAMAFGGLVSLHALAHALALTHNS
jgi:hypothetical protein